MSPMRRQGWNREVKGNSTEKAVPQEVGARAVAWEDVAHAHQGWVWKTEKVRKHTIPLGLTHFDSSP